MSHVTDRPPQRDLAALRRHYDIERELADRLRAATAAERKSLYAQVYNELFVRVPDHPQNTRKADPAQQRASAERQLRFLSRFLTPDSVYLEVGAGDGDLAMRVAANVRQSYAVDVSDVISSSNERPANFKLILSDGVRIDVPPGTVDVGYSNQLVEHLHPEDARTHLQEMFAALAPGGRYVVVTPHGPSGPHDISKFFSEKADGFHLREYTYRGLREQFRLAGFARTEVWVGVKGSFFRLASPVVMGVERTFECLPWKLRQASGRSPVGRPFFSTITMVGCKA